MSRSFPRSLQLSVPQLRNGLFFKFASRLCNKESNPRSGGGLAPLSGGVYGFCGGCEDSARIRNFCTNSVSHNAPVTAVVAAENQSPSVV